MAYDGQHAKKTRRAFKARVTAEVVKGEKAIAQIPRADNEVGYRETHAL